MSAPPLAWERIFPYSTFRPNQDRIILDVARSLLTYPATILLASNGMGKTSTALASAIALLEQKKIKRIYILTRTHRQMMHYTDTIQQINTRRGNGFLSSVEMASRQHLCINHIVTSGDADTYDLMCHKLVKRREGIMWCSQEAVNGKLWIKKEITGKEPITADVAHLVAFGKIHHICPYHHARLLAKTSQIIIGSYNYIFDPFLCEILDFKLKDSLVIVDEAHNILNVIENALKRELNTHTIKRLLDVSSLPAIILQTLAYADLFLHDVVAYQQVHRGKLLTYKAFGDLMKKNAITSQLLDSYEDAVKELALNIKNFVYVNRLVDILSFFRIYTQINAKSFLSYSDTDTAHHPHRVKIGIQSLDLRPVLARLIARQTRLLFMTGTWDVVFARFRLGLTEGTGVSTIVAPPVYRMCQVYTCDKGIMGTRLNTYYENRSNWSIIEDYGKTIQQLVSQTPNGSAIFFPSYDYKKTTLEAWEAYGIVRRRDSAMFFITTDGGEVPLFNDLGDDTSSKTISSFKTSASAAPSVLCACFRSRASEGEDYAGKMVRGIFIIGVPLSRPSGDVQQKIAYFNQVEDGMGDYWHTADAIEAVNQACGRGIRDPSTDDCVIYLLDLRYGNNITIFNLLSDWIRSCVLPSHAIEDINSRICDFYKK